jgi:hypothetical protein
MPPTTSKGKEEMKNYRNAIATLLLAFVLSTPAFAEEGIIWTGRTPPPPPPTQTESIIHPDETTPAPEEDTLTAIALTLLQTLLPLL